MLNSRGIATASFFELPGDQDIDAIWFMLMRIVSDICNKNCIGLMLIIHKKSVKKRGPS